MRDSVRDEMRDCISMKNSVFTAFTKRVGLWDIFPAYIALFYKNIIVIQKIFSQTIKCANLSHSPTTSRKPHKYGVCCKGQPSHGVSHVPQKEKV